MTACSFGDRRAAIRAIVLALLLTPPVSLLGCSTPTAPAPPPSGGQTIHLDFNEMPWFNYPTSTTHLRRAQVQDLYVVSFFRKYLRGEEDHFLDGAPPDDNG